MTASGVLPQLHGVLSACVHAGEICATGGATSQFRGAQKGLHNQVCVSLGGPCTFHESSILGALHATLSLPWKAGK